MIDTQPGEEKVLIEEKLKKVPAEKTQAPVLGAEQSEVFGGRGQGEAVGAIGGAAAAAGVLTAIDEDEEGGEEASVPKDFEYFTDVEDDE
jgi:26S proteasome regulatory subunit N2